MQCADCQRRGNGAAGAVVGAVSPPSSTTQVSPLLHQNGVSPGSPTPPASPQIHPTAAPNTKQQSHHHPLLLPPTPPQSQLMLAVTTNNIDLSLPLTSTLLKRATLAGVSHQQLLGLDRAVSFFCPLNSTFLFHSFPQFFFTIFLHFCAGSVHGGLKIRRKIFRQSGACALKKPTSFHQMKKFPNLKLGFILNKVLVCFYVLGGGAHTHKKEMTGEGLLSIDFVVLPQGRERGKKKKGTNKK